MAGYMPARSDFATEYDNYAELDLKTLDFSDTDDEIDLCKLPSLCCVEVWISSGGDVTLWRLVFHLQAVPSVIGLLFVTVKAPAWQRRRCLSVICAGLERV